MAQVTNIVLVKINGLLVQSKGDVSFNAGTPEREEVYADNRMIGPTESPRVATVEFKVAHTAGTDIVALGNITDADVQVETDTGSVYQISNAFVSTAAVLSGESAGDVAISIKGDPAITVAA